MIQMYYSLEDRVKILLWYHNRWVWLDQCNIKQNRKINHLQRQDDKNMMWRIPVLLHYLQYYSLPLNHDPNEYSPANKYRICHRSNINKDKNNKTVKCIWQKFSLTHLWKFLFDVNIIASLYTYTSKACWVNIYNTLLNKFYIERASINWWTHCNAYHLWFLHWGCHKLLYPSFLLFE